LKKKKSILIMLLSLVFLLVLISGCNSDKSNVKTAQISSVINSVDSVKQNDSYTFDNGKLDVNITIAPFNLSKKEISNTEYDKKVDDTVKDINKEFPNENITKEDLQNSFEKSFKNVTFSVQEENKKVVISGKDVNLEFKMSDSNKNRLIDNQGNEYELKYEKK